MTEAAAKFEANDTVRFIGTETLYKVTHSHENKHVYQVQRGDDAASSEWVEAIYLEQA
jgi:hypothetical protein